MLPWQAYVPGRPDGSSSPWAPDSGRVGCALTDAAPVTALDTIAESHVSAIFRLTLTRTVNPHVTTRRPVTSSARRTFESGHLFRNFTHAWPAILATRRPHGRWQHRHGVGSSDILRADSNEVVLDARPRTNSRSRVTLTGFRSWKSVGFWK